MPNVQPDLLTVLAQLTAKIDNLQTEVHEMQRNRVPIPEEPEVLFPRAMFPHAPEPIWVPEEYQHALRAPPANGPLPAHLPMPNLAQPGLTYP